MIGSIRAQGLLSAYCVFLFGEIMMWAPGVPGNMSHGAPGPVAFVGNPVDSAVAYGV